MIGYLQIEIPFQKFKQNCRIYCPQLTIVIAEDFKAMITSKTQHRLRAMQIQPSKQLICEIMTKFKYIHAILNEVLKSSPVGELQTKFYTSTTFKKSEVFPSRKTP